MSHINRSMEALSAMQLTENMDGLDAKSKVLCAGREVLAVILGEVVTEYKGYSRKEIMEFIGADLFDDKKEVSPGRTNTTVQGGSAEFNQLNEKVSYFDLIFRAKNPALSTEDIQVDLHIDMESQKTYRPGYPVEKRGLYYLARMLSSQLTLVTDTTDYGQLEKCYSIWIRRDDIPKNMQYSVSVYEVTNAKEKGSRSVPKEDYDLMTLVVIKLGDMVYNGKEEDEDYGILHFLNLIMYPHTDTFMKGNIKVY